MRLPQSVGCFPNPSGHEFPAPAGQVGTSSMLAHSSRSKPAIHSFVSAYGPSVADIHGLTWWADDAIVGARETGASVAGRCRRPDDRGGEAGDSQCLLNTPQAGLPANTKREETT